MNPVAQRQEIADHIQTYGWHCLHVLSNEAGEQNFSYTIGFEASYGAPEIVVFGLERDKAHALLNECADLLKGGHAFKPDVEDAHVLAGDYKVVFKSVRAEMFSEYLGTAVRYYQGKPFAAMVMFLPDSEHRYPWQAGYDYISTEEALTLVC